MKSTATYRIRHARDPYLWWDASLGGWAWRGDTFTKAQAEMTLLPEDGEWVTS